MPSYTTQATRLLAAAALRGSNGVRTSVLDWLSDPNRAVAPELGVDLSLVAGVAQFAENRERVFNYAFAGLTVAAGALFLAGATAPTLAVVVIASGTLWFKKKLDERERAIQYFRRDRFDLAAVEQRFMAPLRADRAKALPSAEANVTTYSGFSPFVGAGFDMGGWSFAVATDKGKDGYGHRQPTAFSLPELYEAIGKALERLELPRFEQHDHFFVHGTDVNDIGSLLYNRYGRPEQSLPASLVDVYRHGSDRQLRHYRWIRVEDWDGEIVMSRFLRCCFRGPTLFVEVRRYLLTPLQAALRDIDDLVAFELQDKIGLFIVSVLPGAWKLIAAPLALFGYVSEFFEEQFGTHNKGRNELIDRKARWDYGATTSLRQTFATDEYVRYFQRSDADWYDKTLEKEMLDAMVTFLDARGVDTSDLRERQSTILNHGVIVQGGNIEAGSLAVGDKARAVQRRVSRVVKKAAGGSSERGAA